jgi:hypothetical protein
MPLMVPTYLSSNDLRHQLNGSDMVGPGPIIETLKPKGFGVFRLTDGIYRRFV